MCPCINRIALEQHCSLYFVHVLKLVVAAVRQNNWRTTEAVKTAQHAPTVAAAEKLSVYEHLWNSAPAGDVVESILHILPVGWVATTPQAHQSSVMAFE